MKKSEYCGVFSEKLHAERRKNLREKKAENGEKFSRKNGMENLFVFDSKFLPEKPNFSPRKTKNFPSKNLILKCEISLKFSRDFLR